jgi:hypothetical protein
MSLATGSKLGPYKILAPIGADLMGEVLGSRSCVTRHMGAGNNRLAGPANGCIEKLSAERMHTKIEVFAKVIHKMDATMTAAELQRKP